MGGISSIPSQQNLDFIQSYDHAPAKYDYHRPLFLTLTDEESSHALDRQARQIITAKSELPRQAGYAEVINSGKSKLNEDQAAVGIYMLHSKNTSSQLFSTSDEQLPTTLPYQYFAIFDGHNGAEAATYVANSLHLCIYQRLSDIQHLLTTKSIISSDLPPITNELLITGAIEEAFKELDQIICNERLSFSIKGGCTTIMALYFDNYLFVANAGDCRALFLRNGKAQQFSTDFNPITDRQRLQYLAYLQPQLLHGYYSRYYYRRRIRKADIGKPVLYKDMDMTGWGIRTATEEDLELVPMIRGEGKQCRLLDIISTTRGFGDFDLQCYEGGPHLKPFLTSTPEVKMITLNEMYDPNDVLILGSDGLYESLTNEEIGKIVFDCLDKYDRSDKTRYNKAAEKLMENCRGTYNGRYWMKNEQDLASQDDATVFIIPFSPEDC